MHTAPSPHLERGLLRFFPTPRFLTMPATGLDISDSSVKFLELEYRHGRYSIACFGDRPIPPGVVEKGRIMDRAQLVSVLTSLRRDFDLSFVRASLPEEEAYIFTTTVPAGSTRSEMRSAIEFRLEENVPISAAEAVFDWEHLEGAPTNAPRAAVCVYPRTIVRSYADAMRAAGLSPLSFEVETQAMARALIAHDDPGTYFIIDFGRARTGLAIVSNHSLLFTATLEIGGNTLTQAIVKEFKVTPEEAEQIKNEKGFLRYQDKDDLFMALMNTVSALRDEINRHIVYWHSRKDEQGNPMPRINGLILGGGNANLAGLPEYLSASLKMRAEVANPWRNIFSFEDAIPPIDREHSLGYGTSIGLALRSGLRHD